MRAKRRKQCVSWVEAGTGNWTCLAELAVPVWWGLQYQPRAVVQLVEQALPQALPLAEHAQRKRSRPARAQGLPSSWPEWVVEELERGADVNETPDRS